MSDHVDVTGSSRKRPADVRLMSLPGALWRGLVTGVASLLLAAGIFALATTWLDASEPGQCGNDGPCVPPLAPIALLSVGVPTVLALSGGVIARLLRLPEPGLFALPAVCLLIAVCGGPTRWMYGHLRWVLAIMLASYCVIALAVVWQQRAANQPVPTEAREPGA